MNIDTQPLKDFEAAFSRVMDTLESLKRLEPPPETGGAIGLAKWFQEFHQTLLMLPTDIDATHLTRFAEEVEAALAKTGRRAAVPRPVLEEQRMLPTPRGFWAEIVSETGSGAYTFKEKRLTDGTTWADLSGGRTGTVYETNDVTGIVVGAIIKIAVEHDTSGTLRYVFDYSRGDSSATSTRIVKIVSYAGGVYVVQPVVRASSAWANDGSQLTGIHNYGEVQTEEAGYLAGPGGENIYIPLFTAGDESFMLVHPPRMV